MTSYAEAIRQAHIYLLDRHPEVFVMGQGLWSPWYVGNSMTDLDKIYGTDRILDTPVSESACTGIAVGASLSGMRPIMVHPRMDFMLLAIDPIVNQAAKWSYIFGGQVNPAVTFRAIINRGGEQGAQHSQCLHSWFAHIPGLRVVMPYTVSDARDLLIASVLSDDPVLYIDDRWLYDEEEEHLVEPKILDLKNVGPSIIRHGDDITIVGCGYGTHRAIELSKILASNNISAEVIDIRVVNPFDSQKTIESVRKTGRLLVIDPGTKTCSFASEVITSVVENLSTNTLKKAPLRFTLPDTPAPTSNVLESEYYLPMEKLLKEALSLIH